MSAASVRGLQRRAPGGARFAARTPRTAFGVATALALFAALSAAAPCARAAPKAPADLLDEATACRRRAKTECVLERAAKAREALGTSPDAAGRRLLAEALELVAEALALLGRAEDAVAAFGELIDARPAYRPPGDAPAEVLAAFEAAREARVESSLPDTLGPGPLPPTPRPTPAELLPPPQGYVPPGLLALDTEAAKRRNFRLAIGGGAAFVSPGAEERVNHGVAVAVDFEWLADDLFGLWIQAQLTLHDFSGNLSVEPGFSRGLTTAGVAVGGSVRVAIIDRLEAFASVGLGVGMYGLQSIADVAGVGIQGILGLRYGIDDTLAVRLDAMPTITLPVDGTTPGGHIGLMLRGESKF